MRYFNLNNEIPNMGIQSQLIIGSTVIFSCKFIQLKIAAAKAMSLLNSQDYYT